MNAYAEIDLTDFSFALGGEHFYVDVHVHVVGDKYDSVSVTQTMTRGFAKRLNEKDGTDDMYAEGDDTKRFECEESAIARAIEVVNDKWPFVDMVFMDSTSNPTRCVMCEDKELMAKINDIYERWNAFYKDTQDPWANGDAVAIDNVYVEWEEVLKEIE